MSPEGFLTRLGKKAREYGLIAGLAAASPEVADAQPKKPDVTQADKDDAEIKRLVKENAVRNWQEDELTSEQRAAAKAESDIKTTIALDKKARSEFESYEILANQFPEFAPYKPSALKGTIDKLSDPADKIEVIRVASEKFNMKRAERYGNPTNKKPTNPNK